MDCVVVDGKKDSLGTLGGQTSDIQSQSVARLVSATKSKIVDGFIRLQFDRLHRHLPRRKVMDEPVCNLGKSVIRVGSRVEIAKLLKLIGHRVLMLKEPGL